MIKPKSDPASTEKRDSRLRTDSLVNILGSGAHILIQVLLAPFYIRLLGIEQYGVIGFYLTLNGVLSFLEFGLTRILSKEVAVLSENQQKRLQLARTVRSFEGVFWVFGVLLISVGLILSPMAAKVWLASAQFSEAGFTELYMLMAMIIGANWPRSIYYSVFIGLQQHKLKNVLQILISIITGAGAVLVLTYVNTSLYAFLTWQLIIGMFGTILLLSLSWYSVGLRYLRVGFSYWLVAQHVRFASGIALNKLLVAVLNNADRLTVSALLPLRQFGYYSLAHSIVRVIPLLANPIATTVFPQLALLVGKRSTLEEIRSVYKKAAQWVSLITIPAALTMVFFSREILTVYLSEGQLADNTYMLLSVLAVGKMCYNFMAIPFSLQVAYGWITVNTWVNAISVLIYVPLLYVATIQFNAVGAAMSYAFITLVDIIVISLIVHRKLLHDDGRIMVQNLLLPMMSTGLIAFPFKALLDFTALNQFESVVSTVLYGVIAIFSTALVLGVFKWSLNSTNLTSSTD